MRSCATTISRVPPATTSHDRHRRRILDRRHRGSKLRQHVTTAASGPSPKPLPARSGLGTHNRTREVPQATRVTRPATALRPRQIPSETRVVSAGHPLSYLMS